jgi:hypothetical protein
LNKNENFLFKVKAAMLCTRSRDSYNKKFTYKKKKKKITAAASLFSFANKTEERAPSIGEKSILQVIT